MIRAALFDVGGVITASPFDGFNRYEMELGVPKGSISGVIRQNAGANAWACYERGELDLDAFARQFEAEALLSGLTLDARACTQIIRGEIRPEMVDAIRSLRTNGLLVGVLTNNFPGGPPVGANGRSLDVGGVVIEADVILESSRVGCRKPERRFYELACEALAIAPQEAVFLDDLGTNLKPAREMGMTTIKVENPDRALEALSDVLGFSVTNPQPMDQRS
jgi:putative hydrolase of the HAD superfamily